MTEHQQYLARQEMRSYQHHSHQIVSELLKRHKRNKHFYSAGNTKNRQRSSRKSGMHQQCHHTIGAERNEPSKKLQNYQRYRHTNGRRSNRSTRHYGLNETNNRPSNRLLTNHCRPIHKIITPSGRSLSQMWHLAPHLFFILSSTPISLVNLNSLLYLATAIEDQIT